MPYLEIKKQEEAEETNKIVEMIDVIEMNVTDAKKTLNNLGLEVEIKGEGEIVTEQLPKKGIQINEGTKVTIYAE